MIFDQYSINQARSGCSWTDSGALHAHAKLNAALADAEASQIRAMPPLTKETRFLRSLKLRLSDAERQSALNRLALPTKTELHVYRGPPESQGTKGDFNFAISPGISRLV